MPAETVIILGGERHEKRVMMPGWNGNTLNMALLGETFWRYDKPGPLDVKTISYNIHKLQIGYRHIAAAIHPDITPDTGLRWLADMVLSTWEREGSPCR